MKKLLLIAIVALISACKTNAKAQIKKQDSIKVFNDSVYVLDATYPKNDARRYGVTAVTARQQHPYTKKNRMETVLDIAEETGEEMIFPSGYYGMDLTLDSRKNLNLRFNKSEFSLIHITQRKKEDPIPENITLKGALISYARLGVTEAKNISIDTVYLKSDITKSLYKMRNTGCHIYHGCSNIKIKYLEIDDLGSGDKTYQNSHAALAIDGWNNNPEYVQIKKVHIKSSDRHGIYITGNNHSIGEVIIDRFGMGSSEAMSGMQDAVAGEEKQFKALWVNKSYNSSIETITINTKDTKGAYAAHFDYGDKTRPFKIGTFKVINTPPHIEILEENPNGVIIQRKE